MEASHYRLGYRPDIEGLRAVAVLLVILCHTGVPLFGGGFIGVDVFFVLSGYLISGLLITEFSSHGRISLLRFYARRLQRLAPALLIMLTVTALAIRLLIAPPAQSPHYMAGATAALWLSNLHFAWSELDYFSPEMTENLFLHTWSLSVEEQFYLLWPALIALLLVIPRRYASISAQKALFTGMAALALCSFYFSWKATWQQPILAYYLPTTRAWQFAAGGIALLLTFRLGRGYGEISTQAGNKNSWRYSVLGWLGLIILIVAAVIISEDTPYPGFHALAPTIGTVFILVAGTLSSRGNVARMLSAKPLVFIGGLSYGWYLWHWPILHLTRTINPGISAGGILLAMMAALFAAWLSYRLLESPIRRNRYLLAHPRLFCSVAVALMLAVVAVQFSLVEKNQADALSSEMEKFHRVRNDLPEIYKLQCDEWTDSAALKPCQFGPETSDMHVYLVGDSILGQWFPAFSNIAQKRGWRLTVLTKSACPMVDEPFYYRRIGQRYLVCEQWRDKLIANIRRARPQLVIMGSSHTYPFNAEQWEQGSYRILAEIAGHSDNIFILRSTPRQDTDLTACAANHIWQERKLPLALPNYCSASVDKQQGQSVFTALQSASAGFDNVSTFDLNHLICPQGECATSTGDIFIFRDRHHLSASFMETLTPQLDAFFKPASSLRP